MKYSMLLLTILLTSCSFLMKKSPAPEKEYLVKSGSGLTAKELESHFKKDSFMKFGNYGFQLALLTPDYKNAFPHDFHQLIKTGEQCVLLEARLRSVPKEHHNLDYWRVFQVYKNKQGIRKEYELAYINQTEGQLVREQQGSSPNYLWYQDALFCGDLHKDSSTVRFKVVFNYDKEQNPDEAYTSNIKFKFRGDNEEVVNQVIAKSKTTKTEKIVKKTTKVKKKKVKNARFLMYQRTRKDFVDELDEENQ